MTNPFAKKFGLAQPAAAPVADKASLPPIEKMTEAEQLEQANRNSTAIQNADLGNGKPKLVKMFGTKPATTPTDGATVLAKMVVQSEKTYAETKELLGDDSFSLEDLEDLEGLEDEGTPPIELPTLKNQFDDETPATAPTRELPPEMDKQMTSFVAMIDGVYEIIGDHELLGNVIRNIMIELADNPQYMKLVANEDMRTWVRAMRNSMGLARIKKQEKPTRKAGGAAAKSKAGDKDFADALEDLGIDFS